MSDFAHDPDASEIEAVVTLVLTEAGTGNPEGLLDRMVRLVGRAVDRAIGGADAPPIDPAEFAPQGKPELPVTLRAGIEMAMDRIREDAARNPERKREYDEIARRPDGEAILAERRRAATKQVFLVIRQLLRSRAEALDVTTHAADLLLRRAETRTDPGGASAVG